MPEPSGFETLFLVAIVALIIIAAFLLAGLVYVILVLRDLKRIVNGGKKIVNKVLGKGKE